MKYKLKKEDLLNISKYIISNEDKKTDEELISTFYEFIMNILNETPLSPINKLNKIESINDICDYDSENDIFITKK